MEKALSFYRTIYIFGTDRRPAHFVTAVWFVNIKAEMQSPASPLPAANEADCYQHCRGKRWAAVTTPLLNLWGLVKVQTGHLQNMKETRDRYARYLAEVLHDGQHLSDYLLEIGAASSRAKPWK